MFESGGNCTPVLECRIHLRHTALTIGIGRRDGMVRRLFDIQQLVKATMKTGLIKTDATFDVGRLQREYSKILEEYEPFRREMANPEADDDRFRGYCLRGIDGNNPGEISYTKYYQEKMGAELTEASFRNNTSLYRGYFAELLDELEEKLENLYRIRIITSYSGLDYHKDGPYFRYHIPIHSAKSFRMNIEVNGRVESYDFEDGRLYYFYGEQRHATVNPDREPRVHLVFSSYKALTPS